MKLKALLSVGVLVSSLSWFGHGGRGAIAHAKAPETDARDTDKQGLQGITVPSFKPAEFPFVTMIPDDGTDKAAGWQAARANLKFTRIVLPNLKVIEWYCPFTVGMPLRTELKGVITSAQAATISAAVANSVVASMDFGLPQGIFCHQFVDKMKTTFPTMYPGYGAAVQR